MRNEWLRASTNAFMLRGLCRGARMAPVRGRIRSYPSYRHNPRSPFPWLTHDIQSIRVASSGDLGTATANADADLIRADKIRSAPCKGRRLCATNGSATKKQKCIYAAGALPTSEVGYRTGKDQKLSAVTATICVRRFLREPVSPYYAAPAQCR